MKCVLRWCCMVALLCGVTFVQAQNSEVESAAANWLQLLDKQEFAASWNAASPMFQTTLTREEWVKRVGADRAALGSAVRQIKSVERVSPPNLPPGEYVRLVYDTRFSNAGALQEVLSLQKEADLVWRVAGYFVK